MRTAHALIMDRVCGIIAAMYNWSTDERVLEKESDRHAAWRLEQLINFGLRGEKLNEAELRKYWRRLNIDPARRRFLELLLDER
jgi:hypothetical protein